MRPTRTRCASTPANTGSASSGSSTPTSAPPGPMPEARAECSVSTLRSEALAGVDGPAPDHRQQHLRVHDVGGTDLQDVAVQDDQVRVLAGFERARPAILMELVRAVHRDRA